MAAEAPPAAVDKDSVVAFGLVGRGPVKREGREGVARPDEEFVAKAPTPSAPVNGVRVPEPNWD